MRLYYVSPVNESVQWDEVLCVELHRRFNGFLVFRINQACLDILVKLPYKGKCLFVERDYDDPVFQFLFPYNIKNLLFISGLF